MPRFVPRERKHKRLAKLKSNASGDVNEATSDPNTAEVIPVSQSERESRRQALKQQLREQQPESKVSRQKRKRLDKYVEGKLRKDENAELLRKLEEQQIDTSLLRSSKKLGRVRETKREQLQRALQERGAFGSEDGDAAHLESVLFEPRRLDAQNEQSSEDESVHGAATEIETVSPLNVQQNGTSAAFGSGLKRPGEPISIRRRKRQKKAPEHFINGTKANEDLETSSGDASAGEEDFDDEWNGFSGTDAGSASDSQSTQSSSEASDSDSPASETELEDESRDENSSGRISAFKAWADSQRNLAVGFTPAADHHTVDPSIKANFKPRAPSPDPILESLSSTAQSTAKGPSAAISILRSEETQAARLELPVVQEEQKIVETINAHPVTVICGATGSGKTTQVPQMLFENGCGSLIGTPGVKHNSPSAGMIGITQPRRVAATSVAERVGHELGNDYKKRVAHQVRYDTNVSKDTAIKFMTDGILLREIQSDFPLSKYSCIIIDEAHERSVNTDILIGMLSRIVPLRAELAVEEPDKFCPLKLVIMSATLRVNDFLHNERLFPDAKPPVVEVEGRQFSVTEHFARRTKRDYVEEVIDKVAKGHRRLPPGGMLVFLTGQQEIVTVAKRLKEKLEDSRPFWRTTNGSNGHTADDFEDHVVDMGQGPEYLEGEEELDDSDADINIDAEADNEFSIPENGTITTRSQNTLKPHILPLYAALPASQQQKVFLPPPDGHRPIVLATNVAETSLTIPGIRYVFDSGRSKEKRYDERTGIQTFEIDWISKASAEQRKGRAGRTGPGGHVWRLYSSAVYEQYFNEHTAPEILQTPLESVVLQLKGLEIERVANFPFPTAPEAKQLINAEKLLSNLGAIDGEKITDSGKEIVRYPLSPRFGRMLMLAKQNNVVPHAIALVAALAVGDLYIPEQQSSRLESAESGDESEHDEIATRHQAYTRAQATLSRWDDRSDAVKLLTAVAAHADAQSKGLQETAKLCKDFWLREKGMNEMQQLRQQLHSILASQDNTSSDKFQAGLSVPTDKQRAHLNQIVGAGFIDQVAIRADLLRDDSPMFGRKPTRAIEVPYRTLIPTKIDSEINRSASPQNQEIRRSVFVHPSSVLARLSTNEMPQYIVYSHLSQAPAAAVDGRQKKTRMHPLTTIGSKAFAVLAEGSPLLELGKPIGKIEELPDRKRQCWVGISIRPPDVGGQGWPLGSWKVIQRRSTKGDWIVDKVIAR